MAKYSNIKIKEDLSGIHQFSSVFEEKQKQLQDLKSQISSNFLSESFDALKLAYPQLTYLSWTQKYEKHASHSFEIVNIQINQDLFTDLNQFIKLYQNKVVKEFLMNLFDDKEFLLFVLGIDSKIEFS